MTEIMAKRETPGKGPCAPDLEVWLRFSEKLTGEGGRILMSL